MAVIGVVVSRADEASVHVGERLLDLVEWTPFDDPDRPDGEGGGTAYRRDGFELREFDDLHLSLEGVAEVFGGSGVAGGPDAADAEPDLVVFVSRHSGETGPLLSAHFTGNLGPAEYGGRPDELADAAPNALARVLSALDRHAPDGYDVAMECTHHGPTDVGAPSMFVEVGSAVAQWRDPRAAEAVARAVLDLEGVPPGGERAVVGLGGGHYAPRFTRIVRETDWAVGHVLADWSLDAVDSLPPALLEQAFERSGATRAVVDGDRPAIVDAVEERGYRVVSETWVRETADVSLDVVRAAESALAPVDEGLRFGDVAVEGDGRAGGPGSSADVSAEGDGSSADDGDGGADRTPAVSVVGLNPDLVGAAMAVDADATRGAFERHAVAFATEEAGNRPTGRVALDEAADLDPLVDSLASVLARDAVRVERDAGEVVVVRSRFDPAKARELGVPEGPAFGRLADGEAVEVDGETVEPAAVHTERVSRYPVRPDRS